MACVTEKNISCLVTAFEPLRASNEAAIAPLFVLLSFLIVTFDVKMAPSAAPGAEESRATVRRMLREVLVGREDPEGFFALCLSALGHRETRSQFPSYIQPLSTSYSALHGCLTAIYTEYFSQVSSPAPSDFLLLANNDASYIFTTNLLTCFACSCCTCSLKVARRYHEPPHSTSAVGLGSTTAEPSGTFKATASFSGETWYFYFAPPQHDHSNRGKKSDWLTKKNPIKENVVSLVQS